MRTSVFTILIFLAFVFFIYSCSSLQKARIRQEVTIDTHFADEADLNNRNRMMVLTLAQEEKTLSKTTLTANEAASDILSLELLNRGFQVLDRAVVNDYMEENEIKLNSTELTKIIVMGQMLDTDFLILTNLFENIQASHKINFLPWNVLTTVDTSANIGVSARMIDLKKEEVIWFGIATTQDQNFQKSIQRIAMELISSLENHSSNKEE
jgi:curli biogenesis system outer membrane secretion channel CsgG